MKKKNIAIAILVGVISIAGLKAESKDRETCFFQSCVQFRLGQRWVLGERQVEFSRGKADHYKMGPLTGTKGRVIPSVSIVFMQSNEQVDPILYNTFMRSKVPMQKLEESIILQPLSGDGPSDNSETGDKSSRKNTGNVYKFIGFRGTFDSQDITYTQYLITATDDKMGIAVIITCPKELFGQIEDDVKEFLKTLKHVHTNRVVLSPDQRNALSKKLFDDGMLEVRSGKRNENGESDGLQKIADSCDLGHPQACDFYNTVVGLSFGSLKSKSQ